jgi:hypothetical protein
MGELLASVMQEEDVGHGAWHDRFNRSLENTKECTTKNADRVHLFGRDYPKPDADYAHEQLR